MGRLVAPVALGGGDAARDMDVVAGLQFMHLAVHPEGQPARQHIEGLFGVVMHMHRRAIAGRLDQQDLAERGLALGDR